MSSINFSQLQAKLKETTVTRDRQPVFNDAQLQQANNLVKNFASNGATLGETVAGFKSLTEEVRPALEERAAELRKLADPVISEMTESVPGVTVTSQPTTKSNVDTLAGKTTASQKKLRKVISSGNPKAINEVLSKELKAAGPAIKQATNQASNAVNDPKVQEQLKSLGMPEDVLSDFNSKLSVGGVNSLMSNIETDKLSAGLAQASTTEMRALKNPFGTDATPLGPKGLDFGNILGSVGGIAANTGVFQGVGNPLDAIQGGIDPISKNAVAPLIDFGGNTNLAKSVDKGNKLSLDGPTTTVFEVTGQVIVPQSLGDFTYEKVNGKKELELELSQTNRILSTMYIGWVGTSGSDDNWTAKEWNEKVVQVNQSASPDTIIPISTASWQANYFIRKDGTVERLMPIEYAPYQNDPDFDLSYKNSFIVSLDAGFTVPRSEASGLSELSADSITAAQWKTIDMFLQVFFRLPTSRSALSLSYNSEDETLGPGFDVEAYSTKFRKPIAVSLAEEGSAAAEKLAELAKDIFGEDDVSFDKDRREYIAKIGETLKPFADKLSAIANTRI